MSASRVKDVSDEFMVEDAPPSGGFRPQEAQVERETDPHRLAQRQKQIDLGKNTLGYQRYREAVPRDARNRRTDPWTPDVHQVCSKRAFEGQVKKWRRQLHAWDPPEDQEEGGTPALLPVHADVGRPSSNPPPPSAEPSDDFEHITHADAGVEPSYTPHGASPGSSARSKNGGRLRPVGRSLPLKIPSAMRKRAYDETVVAGSENQRPQHNHRAQVAAAPGAKQQRRSAELEPRTTGKKAAAAGATPGTAPQSVQSWADQRFEDPELDYGASDDEEQGGLGHAVQQPKGRHGQRTVIYNNFSDWDEDDIQM